MNGVSSIRSWEDRSEHGLAYSVVMALVNLIPLRSSVTVSESLKIFCCGVFVAQAIVGQGGDLINLHINCPNIRDIPNNQIPLQKVGNYWGFDTHSVTVQYTETIAIFKVSSEVIKCPTIRRGSLLWSKPLCCPPSAHTGGSGA